MSAVAHFFMSVAGSKIHERLAHFFIDIYRQGSDQRVHACCAVSLHLVTDMGIGL